MSLIQNHENIKAKKKKKMYNWEISDCVRNGGGKYRGKKRRCKLLAGMWGGSYFAKLASH